MWSSNTINSNMTMSKACRSKCSITRGVTKKTGDNNMSTSGAGRARGRGALSFVPNYPLPAVPPRPNSNKRETLADIADRIPLEVMRKFFDFPLRTAAEAMSISVTTLKRLCRRHGVKRWPHRQISGINRALSDLEEQQHLAHGDAAQAVADQLRQLRDRRQVIIELAFESDSDLSRTLSRRANYSCGPGSFPANTAIAYKRNTSNASNNTSAASIATDYSSSAASPPTTGYGSAPPSPGGLIDSPDSACLINDQHPTAAWWQCGTTGQGYLWTGGGDVRTSTGNYGAGGGNHRRNSTVPLLRLPSSLSKSESPRGSHTPSSQIRSTVLGNTAETSKGGVAGLQGFEEHNMAVAAATDAEWPDLADVSGSMRRYTSTSAALDTDPPSTAVGVFSCPSSLEFFHQEDPVAWSLRPASTTTTATGTRSSRTFNPSPTRQSETSAKSGMTGGGGGRARAPSFHAFKGLAGDSYEDLASSPVSVMDASSLSSSSLSTTTMSSSSSSRQTATRAGHGQGHAQLEQQVVSGGAGARRGQPQLPSSTLDDLLLTPDEPAPSPFEHKSNKNSNNIYGDDDGGGGGGKSDGYDRILEALGSVSQRNCGVPMRNPNTRRQTIGGRCSTPGWTTGSCDRHTTQHSGLDELWSRDDQALVGAPPAAASGASTWLQGLTAADRGRGSGGVSGQRGGETGRVRRGGSAGSGGSSVCGSL